MGRGGGLGGGGPGRPLSEGGVLDPPLSTHCPNSHRRKIRGGGRKGGGVDPPLILPIHANGATSGCPALWLTFSQVNEDSGDRIQGDGVALRLLG